MKSVTRRELNHNTSQIIDHVLATGEAVEVRTRGRATVVISPKAASVYDEWVGQGLVDQADRRLDEAPTAQSASTVKEILADLGSDH